MTKRGICLADLPHKTAKWSSSGWKQVASVSLHEENNNHQQRYLCDYKTRMFPFVDVTDWNNRA